MLDHARAALAERRAPAAVLRDAGAALARLTGSPYVRPLWWESPGDRVLRDCEDAFLLGGALLVAPVLDPGLVRRPVRLPRGRWYDRATARAYEGPGRVLVDAPFRGFRCSREPVR